MAQLNFDATQVEPDTGFDTVPAGWYNVMMDESDLKPTKDGHGTYLQARFNILDGQYKGRKLFTRLNIRNANAQAQEIALRQLSAIGHAVGVLHIADSQQLHGIPLKVKVKIRKGDDNYEDQNEIISYKNINEQVDTSGGGQGAGAPPVPQGFAPPQQQPGFAPQPQPQQFQPQPTPQPQPQQFQPQPQPQAQPQFAPQPEAQPQPQPWAQPPMATAPQPQPQEQHPFQTQPQPQPQGQPQPWNGGQAQPQPQPQQQPQGQPDPHAAAATQAQQQPPPWANQGQPQG
jgi:hypothetical protein